MHPVKISNHERESGNQFPWFRSANPHEKARIRSRIWTAANALGQDSEIQVAKTLLRQSAPVEGHNAESVAFDMTSAVRAAGLPIPDLVFLHWNTLDDVDVMHLSDFAGAWP